MLQHAGRRTRGTGAGSEGSSHGRRGSLGVGLVAVVVAVGVASGRMVGQDVQLVHLGARVKDHQLVLGDVGCRRRQIGNGFGFDALEVHVAALALFLLPRHADEGPLDVVVDDLRTTSGTLLDLLLVCGVTWTATCAQMLTSYFLQQTVYCIALMYFVIDIN